MPKAQLTWEVNWDERIIIAALTERLFEEGARKEALVALLEDRDEDLAARLCTPSRAWRG